MDGLSGEAYSRIEALIVFEELTPGSLVSEKRLMELTGLGRTPVREAIQSLARHRMLTVFPSKGILIPPIMAEDEYALLEVRRALEAAGIEFLDGGAPGVRLRPRTFGILPGDLNASNDD